MRVLAGLRAKFVDIRTPGTVLISNEQMPEFAGNGTATMAAAGFAELGGANRLCLMVAL